MVLTYFRLSVFIIHRTNSDVLSACREIIHTLEGVARETFRNLLQLCIQFELRQDEVVIECFEYLLERLLWDLIVA